MTKNIYDKSNFLNPRDRLQEITQDLCKLFNRQLSLNEVNEMIKPLENFLRGRSRAATIKNEVFREKLEKIINKSEACLKELIDFKKLDMQLLTPLDMDNDKFNKQDEAIRLIQEQIDLAKEARTKTLQKNNPTIDIERLEFNVFRYLFILAEKKYGLKPDDKGGRGNKDPFLEFVGIITGCNDQDKFRRHYAKFKNRKTEGVIN